MRYRGVRTMIGLWLAVGCLGSLAGCGGLELIPTPNLYVGAEGNPFADVPEPLRTTTMDVLYVTDRRPSADDDGRLAGYSYRRSHSLAFGSALLQIGDGDLTWEQLVETSRSHRRSGDFGIELREIRELGRFPATPGPIVRGADGFPAPDPAGLAEQDAVGAQLLDELRCRLALTPVKEAYVYVHGYNNDFEHAAAIIGQIWHFLGRRGVPISYSWPAGRGGLRGYFYDRESGEFTIYHLKQLVGLLVSCPELKRFHIIAHSRGTDVTVSALRELYLEFGGRLKPRSERKLGNVILAAPDLDIDVISQRIVAEEFLKQIARVTIYMSKTDTALGLSTWLFVSQGRIGRVTSIEDLPPTLQARASVDPTGMYLTTSLVDSRVDSGLIGHSYFYDHPAVSSDLILLLRDDLDPGADHGRPLERLGSMLYALYDDYPATSGRNAGSD